MDYLPAAEAELYLWGSNFNAAFPAIASGAGFSPAEVAEVLDHYELFRDAVNAHTAALASAKAAKEDKDDRREAYVSLIRSAVRRLQSHPNTTDAARASLGITVPSGSRAKLPRPTALPQVLLDWSVRGQVTVHVGMTPGNERSNTFPAGCHAVFIEYRTAGSDWQFVAITTTSPCRHRLNVEANEHVSYRCCYLNPRGERGPWSDEVSAWVIAA